MASEESNLSNKATSYRRGVHISIKPKGRLSCPPASAPLEGEDFYKIILSLLVFQPQPAFNSLAELKYRCFKLIKLQMIFNLLNTATSTGSPATSTGLPATSNSIPEPTEKSLKTGNNQGQKQEGHLPRENFPLGPYVGYIFCATLLPLLNLIILFTQSYSLSWQDNFASIHRQNFNYYHIGNAYYISSIIIFLLNTAATSLPWRQLLKLYLLVDSNQICGIAASICYVCLHLAYLCRDLGGNSYDIRAIDIFYLSLLVANNFIFLGYFRTTLVVYRWSPGFTLTFKILVFTSSLSYFAYGILLIIGQDNLSSLLAEATTIVQGFIQSNDFGSLSAEVRLQLTQQLANLSGNISTIQNLISLFVFTSFANICEVLNRMNDFDKSSDLKPNYMIDDEQDRQQPPDPATQELQNQVAILSQQLIFLQQRPDSNPALPSI